MKWILLDSGPLSELCRPNSDVRADAVKQQALRWEQDGHVIIVPEITDFEVRRELLRAGRNRSVTDLDSLGDRYAYLPLTTEAMRLAAQLWAEARQQGRPTAAPFELDGDVILGAQAQIIERIGVEVVVATFNTRHLSRYITAIEPQNIV